MNGLSGVASSDRALIAASLRTRVGDSIDLDEATRVEYPEDNRWDYLLSVPGEGLLVGVEPHSGKDSEISVVIAKKRHARDYLRNHLVDGHRISRWFWVSRGAVGFSRMEPAIRRLDQNGITFAGHCLRSFS